MQIVNLLLIFLLILLTAFFVSAEFAIVKVRKSRIDQLIAEGNKRAINVKKVINNLDGYLSACQLGITITALGLGWLGEPTVEHLLEPVFHRFEISPALSNTLSFAIAFSIITFLHVVLGELAPKTIAIQKAEAVSLIVARPLIIFYKLAYPVIVALNGAARFLVKLLGFGSASEHEVAHTEEELRIILSESLKSGEINQSEYKYVNKIFEFDNRLAKEIMIPRTEMVTISKDKDIDEIVELMAKEQFTRYPVDNGNKDKIIGMINMKELFSDFILNEYSEEKPFTKYIRPIIHAMETIPIHDLLLKMQRERIHMAVLIDEYGGTAGLVTVEDILEEIVGEIRDEFDIDERSMIEKINAKSTLLDGRVLIEEVNDLFNLDIDSTEVDTIGGWMLTRNFEMKANDFVEYEGYQFKIIKITGHQIKQIEVTKLESDQE